MRKSTLKLSLLVAILASVMLLPDLTFPARALTAKGVLKDSEDHVHFNLTLTANITVAAFDITKKWFEEDKQEWISKWDEWKKQWERDHKNSLVDLSNEEEWMNKWNEKWKQLKIEETDKIPDFLKPSFKEKMLETFDYLWNKHINAPIMAKCWSSPASQLGLKHALGHSLNKTLQWIYNTTDVYVKGFDLGVEVTTKTVLANGTYMATGLYNLTESFDLFGVITKNISGTFIRSQFRHLNITEKVDGSKFGFPGWVFTPGKAMFMDLSVFSVPLENWTSTYDLVGNTTTYTLVKDINVTTSYGNVIIDPEMVLVVPGRAVAAGDTITVMSILPTDLMPPELIATTTLVATAVFAGYYITKRKVTKTFPTPRPA